VKLGDENCMKKRESWLSTTSASSDKPQKLCDPSLNPVQLPCLFLCVGTGVAQSV
jgi:hypothetical protein